MPIMADTTAHRQIYVYVCMHVGAHMAVQTIFWKHDQMILLNVSIAFIATDYTTKTCNSIYSCT